MRGQVWWYMPVIPASLEVEIGGSWSEASLGKIARPYSKKQTKAKMVQVVECLPSKPKVLSSKPSTAVVIIVPLLVVPLSHMNHTSARR
jgi:hypothetical protein